MVSATGIALDEAHGDFGQHQGPFGFLHLSLDCYRASRVHPEAHMGCRGCRTSLLPFSWETAVSMLKLTTTKPYSWEAPLPPSKSGLESQEPYIENEGFSKCFTHKLPHLEAQSHWQHPHPSALSPALPMIDYFH